MLTQKPRREEVSRPIIAGLELVGFAVMDDKLLPVEIRMQNADFVVVKRKEQNLQPLADSPTQVDDGVYKRITHRSNSVVGMQPEEVSHNYSKTQNLPTKNMIIVPDGIVDHGTFHMWRVGVIVCKLHIPLRTGAASSLTTQVSKIIITETMYSSAQSVKVYRHGTHEAYHW